MIDFTVWDLARNLLLATRWTLLLSAIALAGGGTGGLILLALRIGNSRLARGAAAGVIEIFQGTPLLLQIFIVYFGLPLLGVDVSGLLAATVSLSLYGSAYLGEIWRGCVDAIPIGQWDASTSLGLRRLPQLLLVILPQACRIALPPTVGFLVQLVKATALTSIVGYQEVTKTGEMLANASFRPFATYGLIALIYFVICYPLTASARHLERKLAIRQ